MLVNPLSCIAPYNTCYFIILLSPMLDNIAPGWEGAGTQWVNFVQAWQVQNLVQVVNLTGVDLGFFVRIAEHRGGGGIFLTGGFLTGGFLTGGFLTGGGCKANSFVSCFTKKCYVKNDCFA